MIWESGCASKAAVSASSRKASGRCGRGSWPRERSRLAVGRLQLSGLVELFGQ